MTLDKIVEKRYQITITSLIGFICFLLGAGVGNIFNNHQLNEHKDLPGHPVTVQRMNTFENTMKDVNRKLDKLLEKQNEQP